MSCGVFSCGSLEKTDSSVLVISWENISYVDKDNCVHWIDSVQIWMANAMNVVDRQFLKHEYERF